MKLLYSLTDHYTGVRHTQADLTQVTEVGATLDDVFTIHLREYMKLLCSLTDCHTGVRHTQADLTQVTEVRATLDNVFTIHLKVYVKVKLLYSLIDSHIGISQNLAGPYSA